MAPQAYLEELLETFTKTGVPGCAVSVCHKGREIYCCEKGVSDVSAKRPFRRGDAIRLFSNTKVFTAVAMLTLVERGKCLLNEPIAKYLPEFEDVRVGCTAGNNSWSTRKPAAPLLIRDCLTMSSGIPYNVSVDGHPTSLTGAVLGDILTELCSRKSFTCRDFTKAIAKAPLLFDPGTSFAYGYSLDVIGALIEVLSDMDFEAYLKQAIFEPLGLKDTGFWLHPEREQQLVPLYDGEGMAVTSLDGSLNNLRVFMSGGGGLLSTLDDLTRFGCCLSMGGTLDGARIIGRKAVDLMRTNHLNAAQMSALGLVKRSGWAFLDGYGYGLGVWTMQDRRESGSCSSIGQFGWNGAAGTCLFIDPDEQFSVAYAQQVLGDPHAADNQPRIANAAYSLL